MWRGHSRKVSREGREGEYEIHFGFREKKASHDCIARCACADVLLALLPTSVRRASTKRGRAAEGHEELDHLAARRFDDTFLAAGSQ